MLQMSSLRPVASCEEYARVRSTPTSGRPKRPKNARKRSKTHENIRKCGKRPKRPKRIIFFDFFFATLHATLRCRSRRGRRRSRRRGRRCGRGRGRGRLLFDERSNLIYGVICSGPPLCEVMGFKQFLSRHNTFVSQRVAGWISSSP